MKTWKKWPLMVAVMALFAASCEEIEGPEGPAGPAGNANVKSYVLSIAPSNWVEMGSPGNPGHMFTALVDTFSVLNEQIATGGLVLVYRIRADLFQTAYIPLPSVDAENGFDRRWDFLYAPGSIGFTVRHNDNNTIRPSSTINYKIVLAPSINGKRAEELQEMSYEEAMSVLETR